MSSSGTHTGDQTRVLDIESSAAGRAHDTSAPSPSLKPNVLEAPCPHGSGSGSSLNEKDPQDSPNPLNAPLRKPRPNRAPTPRKFAPPPWKRRAGWGGYLAESIPTCNIVPTLVLQAFSAGILDATTYADFSTFASNQTGNTILLTVSIVGAHPLLMLTGISLGSFLGSAFVFGHLGHFMGVRRRGWLFLTTLTQALIMFICAILLSPNGSPRVSPGGPHEWLTLSLFAIMSGAQVAMARQSACQEMPTAPMTSSYVDLMADKYIFLRWKHPKAGPRNRRVMYIGAMIVGGVLGAVVHKYAGSWVVVLVTGFMKMAVVAALALAAPEQVQEE
ncbi:hypothetical protein EHS25_005452 [Saitozyma podzolica]|uniref:DUF1275 domain protein n=1 Tax=Saitozyma podzolica TaxID=1890683 RepID=A0A427XYG4_9TREE|nr:hypothetical protein EHS25_005452 [Saitozyma podzolica]